MAKLPPIKATQRHTSAVFCINCQKVVRAYKETGDKIYAHRPDLQHKIFYVCPNCLNYIGTHRDTGEPLGTIPTPELRECRKELHTLLDPLWKYTKFDRSKVYEMVSEEIGYTFHIAQINNMEEYEAAKLIINDFRDMYLKKR